MNIIILVGRLTRDPGYKETHTDKGDHQVASFVLAVPKNFSKEVNYIKVSAFGAQAEFARDYLKQGKRVAVSGELNISNYTDQETGKKVYVTEVAANRLEFADGKDNEQRRTSAPDGFENIPDIYDGEMPFR